MNIFEWLEKLINERGSAAILRERMQLLQDQNAALKAEIESLKQKNVLLETENGELHSENAALKLQNSELHQQERKLNDLDKQFNEEYFHQNNLDPIREKILTLLAQRNLSTEEVAQFAGITNALAEFHLNDLVGSKHIRKDPIGFMILGDDEPIRPWYIEQIGLRYLASRDLIK
jgi:predicted RNase H-like nuclease (RuvC/YqgF family)